MWYCRLAIVAKEVPSTQKPEPNAQPPAIGVRALLVCRYDGHAVGCSTLYGEDIRLVTSPVEGGELRVDAMPSHELGGRYGFAVVCVSHASLHMRRPRLVSLWRSAMVALLLFALRTSNIPYGLGVRKPCDSLLFQFFCCGVWSFVHDVICMY